MLVINLFLARRWVLVTEAVVAADLEAAEATEVAEEASEAGVAAEVVAEAIVAVVEAAVGVAEEALVVPSAEESVLAPKWLWNPILASQVSTSSVVRTMSS
jgi:hypothetical protein